MSKRRGLIRSAETEKNIRKGIGEKTWKDEQEKGRHGKKDRERKAEERKA